MSEVHFPIVGPILVLGFVLPLCALVTKIALLLVARLSRHDALHAWQGLRYVILLSSSAVPMLWIASAGLHQMEGSRSSVCAAGHEPEALCRDVGYFVGVLVFLALVVGFTSLWRRRSNRAASDGAGRRAQARIDDLIARRRSLAGLAGKVTVVARCDEPIATCGVLSPRVCISPAFVGGLDDQALAAALGHELAHVRGWDPLRYFLARWALALNPIGRYLLGTELSLWIAAREIRCDRDAVLAGASPLALASAIVLSARNSGATPLPALGGCDGATLSLRVGLLFAYADCPPSPARPSPVLRLSILPLMLALAVPHGGATGALDAMHVAAERAASLALDALP